MLEVYEDTRSVGTKGRHRRLDYALEKLARPRPIVGGELVNTADVRWVGRNGYWDHESDFRLTELYALGRSRDQVRGAALLLPEFEDIPWVQICPHVVTLVLKWHTPSPGLGGWWRANRPRFPGWWYAKRPGFPEENSRWPLVRGWAVPIDA